MAALTGAPRQTSAAPTWARSLPSSTRSEGLALPGDNWPWGISHRNTGKTRSAAAASCSRWAPSAGPAWTRGGWRWGKTPRASDLPVSFGGSGYNGARAVTIRRLRLMTLPDFLSIDEHGEIRLAGHRVGLFHLVHYY